MYERKGKVRISTSTCFLLLFNFFLQKNDESEVIIKNLYTECFINILEDMSN